MSDANASLDDRDSAGDKGGCRVESRGGSESDSNHESAVNVGVDNYLCWCDGTACSNRTDVPFTVCDECGRLGHRPLPSHGLSPEDVFGA